MNTPPWLDFWKPPPEPTAFRHLVLKDKPLHYTLKAIGKKTPKRKHYRLNTLSMVPIEGRKTRLFLEAACTMMTGEFILVRQGDVEHRGTQRLKLVDCQQCIVQASSLMERGLVEQLTEVVKGKISTREGIIVMRQGRYPENGQTLAAALRWKAGATPLLTGLVP